MKELIRFRTGNGHFAVPLEQTREVRSAGALVPIPSPRPGVVGVIEREGQALTVTSALGPGDRQVIVLETDELSFGVLVQEVLGMARVPDEAVQPAPAGQNDPLVSGVLTTAPGLVLVVDVSGLGRKVLR